MVCCKIVHLHQWCPCLPRKSWYAEGFHSKQALDASLCFLYRKPALPPALSQVGLVTLTLHDDDDDDYLAVKVKNRDPKTKKLHSANSSQRSHTSSSE